MFIYEVIVAFKWPENWIESALYKAAAHRSQVEGLWEKVIVIFNKVKRYGIESLLLEIDKMENELKHFLVCMQSYHGMYVGRSLVRLSSCLYVDIIVCPLSLSYTDSSGEIQINLRKADLQGSGWFDLVCGHPSGMLLSAGVIHPSLISCVFSV